MTPDPQPPAGSRARDGAGLPGGWRLPETDRERALLTRGTFVLHLRPVRLSRRAMRWTHTFGLGGSAFVLFCMLAFTGVLMLLVYQPVPSVAHDSVWTLSSEVLAGALVRGVHYWSANLLVVVAVLHLLRVVFTGGYHRPRRLNWVIGVGLLLLLLASVFTGYLLPWDQRAFWAVTISTGMLAYVPWIGDGLREVVLGGPVIGSDTLLIFYTQHTTILPVLAIGSIAFHFWRVRKAKGVIEPPAAEGDDAKVLFFPHLLVREAAQAAVVIAVVVVLAAMVGAPIGEPANPGMSPNPAKAAWYFMGFQELLIHLHPVWAVCVLPLFGLIGLFALPWLGDDRGPVGSWFLSAGGRRAAVLAALAAVVVTVAGVVFDDVLHRSAEHAPGWFLRGLLPSVVLAAMMLAVVQVARRRFGLGRNELVQTVAVFVGGMFITLTLIGVFCRGPGMALVAPWGM